MTQVVTAAGPLVRVLGVRHHGPGSARSVRAALDELRPDRVLIEGPPDADDLVELVADPDLVPPVALLAYAVDDPGRAAFWPLAEFSPEWVALRWALAAGVPVRFIDLPAAHAPALTGGDADGHGAGGAGGAEPTVGLDEILAITDSGSRVLAALGMELVAAHVLAPEIISRVTFDKAWIVVERGPADLDPASFRLRDVHRGLATLLVPDEGQIPGRP